MQHQSKTNSFSSSHEMLVGVCVGGEHKGEGHLSGSGVAPMLTSWKLREFNHLVHNL
jgi:hypothetical protein